MRKHLLALTHRSWHALLMLLALLALWELGVRLLGVRDFLLPAPSRIALRLLEQPGYLLAQSLSTLGNTLVGFALAVGLGVAAAIAIVSSRFLDRTLYSLLIAMNAVPKVALAPLFVIWLGTGALPKIAIALLIAIFPILINGVLGLRSTDSDMLDMARVNKASRSRMLWKIRFPNALPSLFAGMKVGVSFALIGTIVGEFVAGEAGLGHVILVAQGSFDTSTVFAALTLLGAMGVLLFQLIEWAERRLLGWHASQRVVVG